MGENREFRLDEINILSVCRDLLRNSWLILLAAISAWMLMSVYIKAVYTPEYTSRATLVISSKGSMGSYTALNMTNEMAGVFAEVFQSEVLRDTVAKELGMEKITERITTSVIPETNLLRVSVTADSPRKAFEILDSVMDNYPVVSDYLFSNAVLDVIKEPNIPIGPSNSFPEKKYMLLALIMGVGLVGGGITVLSVFRDTVKTVSCGRHNLDGRLLGVIGHEVKNKTYRAKRKKKNIAALIINPLVSFSYMEAYQSLCSKLDYHMRKRDQKIILVTSACENEGKSTVAANLALSLASRNKKVLLVDCDFKKPAMHKVFEIDKDTNTSFGHYLKDPNVNSVSLVRIKNHNLLLAHNKLSSRNTQQLVTSDRLKGFLKKVRNEMDYVVLDSPPMLITSDAEALAAMADVSILVIRQDHGMVGDINDCMDLLRASSPDFAGYVLNDFRDLSTMGNKKRYMYDSGTGRYQIS